MNNIKQNIKSNKFKNLLKIEHGEEKALLYFLALFALLGISSAIGKASADALFLKRYGVEYLPTMYILLSISLAFFSTLYAAFVDRLLPEQFFKIILMLLTGTLLLFWTLMSFTSLDNIFPAYYLLYKIISEIIIVHAAFYLDKNLDTMQSKRLTPIILAGYQAGMIVGGIVLATMAPIIGVQYAPIIWLVFTVISVGAIFLWHNTKGTSPYYYPPSKSNKNQLKLAIDEVRHGIGFIKKSPLLRDASYAFFFMVIAYYVISYSANSIYTETFSNEADLTAFLGWLVAGTNAIALLLQVFIANRTIEKIGVRKTKYIFPLSMMGSFIAFIMHPSLIIAVMSSISRESIMPAFRNPSRQMYFNVLPDYMKGRARATAVVVVMPAALLICGILLIILNQLNTLYVYALGLVSASIYLYYCFCMGNNYISTLIDNMRERLFIPNDTDIEKHTGHSQRYFESLIKGLDSQDEAVSLSYARLLMTNFKQQSVQAILKRLNNAENKYANQLLVLLDGNLSDTQSQSILTLCESKDNHFKATALNIVLHNNQFDKTQLLDDCFNSNSARIRVAAIFAVLNNAISSHSDTANKHWLELFSGDTNDHIAILNLIPILKITTNDILVNHYKNIIISLQNTTDIDLKVKLYNAMSLWPIGKLSDCYTTLVLDISHHNQQVRAAAVSCIYICCPNEIINDILINVLDDGHPSVRSTAINTINNNTENTLNLYLSWAKQNKGTPRAQKEIIQPLISNNIDADVLDELTELKIKYALEFFEASFVLSQAKQQNIKTDLINITLQERAEQMVDLILMLLHPVLSTEVLCVIRAGLVSKDKMHIANAREALQDNKDKHMVKQLNTLIEKRSTIKANTTNVPTEADINDVLLWCCNINDHWLRFCGESMLNKERNP